MAQTALPNVGINYDWNLGQDGWKTGMDTNMVLADWGLHPYVTFTPKTVTAQPGSPTNGDVYILGSTHTGADWGAQAENDVAIYVTNTGWQFATPKDGWTVHDRATHTNLVYDDTVGDWIIETSLSGLLTYTGDHTLVLADAGVGGIVWDGVDSPIPGILTIPANATTAFSLGSKVKVIKLGDEFLEIAGAGGVTVSSNHSLVINGENTGGWLTKVGLNEWYFERDFRHVYVDESAAGTTFTFQHDDALVFIEGGDTHTIPGDDVTNFAIGTRIDLFKTTGGSATILGSVAGSPNVTVNGGASDTISNNAVETILLKTAPYTWILLNG